MKTVAETDAAKADKTVRLAKLIMSRGPDINKIANEMGLYKETARYLYKKKILGRSMVIQAIPDELALGLKRIVAKVRIDEDLRQFAFQLFTAMNDLCYVVAFELAIPDDYYMLHACVPVDFHQSYKQFIMKLAEIGLFKSVEVYDFEWFRRVPMRAELYDFDIGRWDFDWQNTVRAEKSEFLGPRLRRRARIDRTDLLILKELQIDASRSLLEINGALMKKQQSELSYKTLHWHYMHHLIAGDLLTGYSIRWLETTYDAQSDRAKHRNHKYLVTNLLIKNLNEQEILAITGLMHQTPFLWCEIGGENYLAQCAFPVDQAVEALEFLRNVMSKYSDRASYYFVDQKNAIQFVLPYKLWNSEKRAWEFSPEAIMPRFENFVLKLKKGTFN